MASNPLGEKRGPKLGDAASLWNFTPSPGWTKEEAQILKLCLVKHGIGRWVQILQEGVLPGKLIQQLNGQTQRLLGQQSLAAYTGLQVDIDRIRADNEVKTDVERKAGLIINTGPNLTKQMKERLREEARAKYGLTIDQVKEVEQQLEALKEELQQEAGAGEDRTSTDSAAPSLMASDPSTLPRQQKLELLKRLHAQLHAAHAQLQAATPASPAKAGAAAPELQQAGQVEVKAGVESPQPQSDAENVASAANTDCMAVDPPATAAAQSAAVGGGKKGAGSTAGGGGKRKAAGAGARVGRTPKAKQAVLEEREASDGDWKPRSGGGRGKGRSKRQLSEDLEMSDAAQEPDTSCQEGVAAANVCTLQEMGFTAKQAQQALEENSGCLDTALEWLAENCI